MVEKIDLLARQILYHDNKQRHIDMFERALGDWFWVFWVEGGEEATRKDCGTEGFGLEGVGDDFGLRGAV